MAQRERNQQDYDNEAQRKKEALDVRSKALHDRDAYARPERDEHGRRMYNQKKILPPEAAPSVTLPPPPPNSQASPEDPLPSWNPSAEQTLGHMSMSGPSELRRAAAAEKSEMMSQT